MRVLLKIYFCFSLAPTAVIFPVLLKVGKKKEPVVIPLSSHFSRSGLFTPEPDYSLVDAPEFPAGENSRERSSTSPQMMDGRQSHVANHLHTGILTSPATKTRPGESTLIMVKPYSGERSFHNYEEAYFVFSSEEDLSGRVEV